MYKILITGIGGDIAQSIAKIIRNSDLTAKIIGADANRNVPWQYFVEDFNQIPLAQDISFLKVLQDIIRARAIDLVIPLIEPEIRVLDNHITEISRIPAQFIMAPHQAIRIFLDKLETMNFLRKNRIRVPWTTLVENEPLSYPCILKHRFGSGSTGLTIIENARDLEYFRQKRPGWILQELLLPEDQEYTCGLYSETYDEIMVIVLKRILRGDVTGAAQVVLDNEIARLCQRIGRLVNLYGSINIQLRRTAEGPIIFEINPRFSSTAIFRDYLGFKDVLWSIQDILDIPHKPEFNQEKVIGHKFYRIFSEVFSSR